VQSQIIKALVGALMIKSVS